MTALNMTEASNKLIDYKEIEPNEEDFIFRVTDVLAVLIESRELAPGGFIVAFTEAMNKSGISENFKTLAWATLPTIAKNVLPSDFATAVTVRFYETKAA